MSVSSCVVLLAEGLMVTEEFGGLSIAGHEFTYWGGLDRKNGS